MIMRLTRHMGRNCFAMLALPLLATAVGAQDSDSSYEARKRNQCRLAVQVIETGQPAPKYEWALSLIRICTEEGGPALAAAWRSAPEDAAKLLPLVVTTEQVDDRAAMNAVLGAARNPANPSAVRFASIVVLTTYADPTATLMFADLAEPTGVIGSRADFTQIPGASPLTVADRDHLVDVLEQIGESDGDPSIREAASSVAAELRLRLRLGRASR